MRCRGGQGALQPSAWQRCLTYPPRPRRRSTALDRRLSRPLARTCRASGSRTRPRSLGTNRPTVVPCSSSLLLRSLGLHARDFFLRVLRFARPGRFLVFAHRALPAVVPPTIRIPLQLAPVFTHVTRLRPRTPHHTNSTRRASTSDCNGARTHVSTSGNRALEGSPRTKSTPQLPCSLLLSPHALQFAQTS